MSSADRLRPGSDNSTGGNTMVAAVRAHWVIVLIVIVAIVWYMKRR